ncbi:MAG: JAB domain-containing protein [Rhodothermales bacterium]
MKTNSKNHTLDLFFNTNAATPAADTSATTGPNGNPSTDSATQPPTGDGLPEAALPALADIVVHRTEPFKVPGLKSLVLPVPVFRVQLVRERDHLTRMVQSPADAARLCSEMLDGYDREIFLVLALSTANRVIGAHVAHVGTVDASIASPREVFKFALLVNARSVIVAHNHPSGNLEPSKADVAVSKQLQKAGEALGVRLLDSLVVGFDGRYTSLSERGLI